MAECQVRCDLSPMPAPERIQYHVHIYILIIVEVADLSQIGTYENKFRKKRSRSRSACTLRQYKQSRYMQTQYNFSVFHRIRLNHNDDLDFCSSGTCRMPNRYCRTPWNKSQNYSNIKRPVRFCCIFYYQLPDSWVP